MSSNFHDSVITRLQSLVARLGGSYVMSSLTNFEHEVIQLLDAIESETLTVSSSAPSAPSVGDRWLDTSDRMLWFWNGTYWLSEQRYDLHANFTTLSASAGVFSLPVNPVYDYWLEQLRFSGQFQTGTYDGSNSWTLRVIRDTASAGTVDVSLVLPNQVIAVAETQLHSQVISLHRDTSALSLLAIRLDALRTGAPPNIQRANSMLFYRLVKS